MRGMRMAAWAVLCLAGWIAAQGADAPAPKDATTPAKSADTATLDLTDFLTQMDAFAVRYAKAENSARKDEVVKEMLARADSLVKGRRISLTAKVQDARVNAEEVAELRIGAFGGLNYTTGEKHLIVEGLHSANGTIQAVMTRAEAMKVVRGQQLQVNGSGEFIPQHWGPAPEKTVLAVRFRFKDAPSWCSGTVIVKPYEVTLGSATYPGPR